MAYNAKKTEHAGPKKGAGAYYGRKSFAKKASNRRRRENDKHEISTVHVVVADNTNDRENIVITVYEPDPTEWEADFKRRKVS